MTDPMDALVDFRRAIAQREIPVQPADFHPDIFLHVDQPAGAPKYTYALVEGGEVTAVALLALTEPIEGVPTFQLGYAVMESRRRADARSVSRWQRSTRLPRASPERDSESVFRGGGRSREHGVPSHC